MIKRKLMNRINRLNIGQDSLEERASGGQRKLWGRGMGVLLSRMSGKAFQWHLHFAKSWGTARGLE